MALQAVEPKGEVSVVSCEPQRGHGTSTLAAADGKNRSTRSLAALPVVRPDGTPVIPEATP